jgi:hypothetical protein
MDFDEKGHTLPAPADELAPEDCRKPYETGGSEPMSSQSFIERTRFAPTVLVESLLRK